MQRNVIFVSFASADRAAARRFEMHLSTSIRPTDGVEVFLDERSIGVGEDWRAEIDQALRQTIAGVFLVSVDLLRSKFVREVEAPQIGQASERGEALFTTLYLGDVNLDGHVVKAQQADGGTLAITFDRYQGLNQPSNPVYHQSEVERDRTYSRAAALLLERVRELRDRSRASQPPSQSLDKLLIQVEPGAERGTLRLRYSQMPDGTHHGTRSIAQEVTPRVRGLPLFRILFPGENQDPLTTWNNIGRALLGQDPPAPLAAPLAVSIATTTFDFLREPLTEVSFDGHSLHESGWSFSLRHAAAPSPRSIDFSANSKCLIGICDPGDELLGAPHAAALASRIDTIWGGSSNILIRRGRDQLLHGVKSYQPKIIYIYGGAGVREHELQLQSDDEGDTVTLTELAAAWGSTPPDLLYLNLVGVDRNAVASVIHPLAAVVPLIILQTSDAYEACSASEGNPRSAALACIDELLRTVSIPNPAWVILKHAHRSTLLWSNAKSTQSSRGHTAPRRLRRIAGLLLDRTKQRENLFGLANELLRGTRTIGAALAFGTAENLVGNFGAQAEAYLYEQLETIPFRRLSVQMDADTPLSAAALLEELRFLFGTEDLKSELERVTPRGIQHRHSLLVLDFGHRHATDAAAILSQTEEWVKFMRDGLAPHRPTNVRILGLLALETPTSSHELEKRMTEIATRTLNPQFRFRVLPELGIVQNDELKEYLITTGFPQKLNIDEAVDLLHKKTEGRFDPLVAELERAETDHWEHVVSELKRTAKTL